MLVEKTCGRTALISRIASIACCGVFLFSIPLSAKDMPMLQEQSIVIPTGEWSVLDFPFKISSISPSTYIVEEDSGYSGQTRSDVDFSSIQEGQKTTPANTGDRPITVNKGDNVIEFFPNAKGKAEFIVWGAKFPIMVKIKAEKNKGDKYFKFIEQDADKKANEEFESVNYEKTLESLIQALWDNKTPEGFKVEASDDKGEISGIKYYLTRKLVNRQYIAEEWIVENTNDMMVKLHEEMFVSKKHKTYGVSLVSNKLNPSEKTKLYIIRASAE